MAIKEDRLPWESDKYLAKKEELSPFWQMLINNEDECERTTRRVQTALSINILGKFNNEEIL